MKKIYIYLMTLSLLICHVACERHDKEEKIDDRGIDSSQLVGEWYHAFASYVEDISFTQNLRFTGQVYEDLGTSPKVSDNISGSWAVSSYGNVLSMDVYRTSTGSSDIKNYSVQSWDDYSLNLKDKGNGSIENYLRVVEIKNMKIGEEYDITYTKNNTIITTSFVSSNSSIVTVSSDGHVAAKSIGIVFITVSCNVGSFIVKVEVK